MHQGNKENNSSKLHIAFGYIENFLLAPLLANSTQLTIKDGKELISTTNELHQFLISSCKKEKLTFEDKKHALHLIVLILNNISSLKRGSKWTSKLKRHMQEALITLYNYKHYNHLHDKKIQKSHPYFYQVDDIDIDIDKIIRKKIKSLLVKNKQTGRKLSMPEFEQFLDNVLSNHTIKSNLNKILLLIKNVKKIENFGLVYVWHESNNPYGYVIFKMGDQGYIHVNQLKAYPKFYTPEQMQYYLQKRRDRISGIQPIAYSDKIKKRLYLLAITKWRWHPTLNNLYSIQQSKAIGQNKNTALWKTANLSFLTPDEKNSAEQQAQINRLEKQQKLKIERKIHGYTGNSMVLAKWLAGLSINQNEFRPNLIRSRQSMLRFLPADIKLHLNKDILPMDIGENMGDCGKYIQTKTIEQNNEIEQLVRKGLIAAGIPLSSANIYAAHTKEAEKLAIQTFKSLTKKDKQ